MRCKIEMPQIMQCAATTCAYNKDFTCHARGITVGGPDDHMCDTLLIMTPHTDRHEPAGVGACHAMNCTHNCDFECQADGVSIGFATGRADCLTFKSRQ